MTLSPPRRLHDGSELSKEPHDYSLIPEGPWNDDIWVMAQSRRSAGFARSVEPCSVGDCDRPASHREEIVDGWRQATGHPLCKSHMTRWRREGKPDIVLFVEEQMGKPIRDKVRKPIPPIAMGKIPERMRWEVRKVIAAKVSTGDWTLNNELHLTLVELVTITEAMPDDASFLDHEEDWWRLRLATALAGRRAEGFVTIVVGRVKVIRKWLAEDQIADPWTELVWKPGLCKATDVRDSNSTTVNWRRMQCPWLREAVMEYAAEELRSKSRAWSTVSSWAKAMTLLDAYIIEVGAAGPEALDREFFKTFLAWAITIRDNPTRRQYVNTVATIIGDLRDDAYLKGVPDVRFFRSTENRVRKVRAPKPIPRDTMREIDRILAEAPELTLTLRRLFTFFRYGGPRPSESVDVPIDAVSRTARGNYKVEYYMPKVEAWRRFPVTQELGEELLAQARWVRETYGPNAQLLFPSPKRSAPAKGEFPGRVEPYTAASLRQRLNKLFERHTLPQSTETSSTYKGSQLHRFRHTIATELLNADWSQYEVQKFLGHKSPTMMQHYAEINDEELAEKYKRATSGPLVDKDGAPATLAIVDDPDLTVDRMAQHLMKAALPNGFCGMPETMSCSFRPNPCLDCDFFRTGKTFLGDHIRHRSELESMVDRAKDAGNDRIVELNQPTIDHLNRLIPRIEASDDGDLVGPR